jgi:hypothetical protein
MRRLGLKACDLGRPAEPVDVASIGTLHAMIWMIDPLSPSVRQGRLDATVKPLARGLTGSLGLNPGRVRRRPRRRLVGQSQPSIHKRKMVVRPAHSGPAAAVPSASPAFEPARALVTHAGAWLAPRGWRIGRTARRREATRLCPGHRHAGARRGQNPARC